MIVLTKMVLTKMVSCIYEKDKELKELNLKLKELKEEIQEKQKVMILVIKKTVEIIKEKENTTYADTK